MRTATRLFCGLMASWLISHTAQAATQVMISQTHLCCRACVVAVDKALTEIAGVKHESSQADGTIRLIAEDDGSIQQAIDALAKAGFYGKLDNPKFKYASVDSPSGKVKRLELTGIHNCCGACTKAIKQALASVSGVQADSAKPKQSEVVIEGDFEAKAVVESLLKAGFYAQVKK